VDIRCEDRRRCWRQDGGSRIHRLSDLQPLVGLDSFLHAAGAVRPTHLDTDGPSICPETEMQERLHGGEDPTGGVQFLELDGRSRRQCDGRSDGRRIRTPAGEPQLDEMRVRPAGT
jgi:hypothetical protein